MDQFTVASGVLMTMTVEGFLSRDEEIILGAWQELRRQRSGTLFVQLVDGVTQKFELRPDYGSAQALNRALGATKLRE